MNQATPVYKKGAAFPLLNFKQRIAYGAGELGPAMAGSTLVFFQLVFLTDVAGVNPGLAGSVLLIARVWDAVNDPLIGWLSDHTRSKIGRRLPWMLAGSVPFALFFTLFWLGPGIVGDAASQWEKFFFYSAVALIYSTVTTALGLTHSAMTAELTHDYDERSRLTAARMGFSLGGSVGGLLLALAVFSLLPDAPQTVQYAVFGVSVAILGLVAVGLCLIGIWRVAIACEKHRLEVSGGSRAQRSLPLGRELLSVLKNRPFLLVCGIYLCSWLAMQFTAGVLPFYTSTVMGLPSTTFQLLALTVQGTALLMIPIWEKLSIRWGKKPVYFLGMLFWIVAQGGLLFLPPGQIALLYLAGFIAGLGISVCYLIPNSMLPDVIEWDELRTGRRREGLYYGFCVFLQKLSLAAGTFFIGQILAIAGYQATGPGEIAVEQPESAVFAIRLAIGPLPALVLVIGLVVAAAYPINRQRHGRMVAILDRRAAKKSTANS